MEGQVVHWLPWHAQCSCSYCRVRRLVMSSNTQLRSFTPLGCYLPQRAATRDFQAGINALLAFRGAARALTICMAMPLFEPRASVGLAFPMGVTLPNPTQSLDLAFPELNWQGASLRQRIDCAVAIHDIVTVLLSLPARRLRSFLHTAVVYLTSPSGLPDNHLLEEWFESSGAEFTCCLPQMVFVVRYILELVADHPDLEKVFLTMDEGFASADHCPHRHQGNEMYKSGDYAKAADEYTKALTSRPMCAIIYSNRAQCRLKQHNFVEAEADALCAVILDASLEKPHFRLITAVREQDKLAAAYRFAQQAVAACPGSHELQRLLGSLEEDMSAKYADESRYDSITTCGFKRVRHRPRDLQDEEVQSQTQAESSNPTNGTRSTNSTTSNTHISTSLRFPLSSSASAAAKQLRDRVAEEHNAGLELAHRNAELLDELQRQSTGGRRPQASGSQARTQGPGAPGASHGSSAARPAAAASGSGSRSGGASSANTQPPAADTQAHSGRPSTPMPDLVTDSDDSSYDEEEDDYYEDEFYHPNFDNDEDDDDDDDDLPDLEDADSGSENDGLAGLQLLTSPSTNPTGKALCVPLHDPTVPLGELRSNVKTLFGSFDVLRSCFGAEQPSGEPGRPEDYRDFEPWLQATHALALPESMFWCTDCTGMTAWSHRRRCSVDLFDVLRVFDILRDRCTENGEVVATNPVYVALREGSMDLARSAFARRHDKSLDSGALESVIIMLLNPFLDNGKDAYGKFVLPRLCAVLCQQDVSTQRAVIEAWRQLFCGRPATYGALKRMVAALKGLVLRTLRSRNVQTDQYGSFVQTAHRYSEVFDAARVLQMLWQAVDTSASLCSAELFCIQELDELVDPMEDAERHLHMVEDEASFLAEASVVLSSSLKGRILKAAFNVEQEQSAQNAMMGSLFTGMFFNPDTPYLVLRVRRAHLVHDALETLAELDPHEYMKPLKVAFEGEPAADEGGVSREFYKTLVSELFSPDYGMFCVDETSRTLYFNAHSVNASRDFYLIGVLLGIAMHNNIIVNVNFPKVLFRKLQGKPGRFIDLYQSHPEIANSLTALMTFEGDVEEVMGLTFSVDSKRFDQVVTHDLMPGGREVPVTNANRHKFIHAYADHVLNVSVEEQFEEFASGIKEICGEQNLCCFEAEELALLLCGRDELDFDILQASALYEGEFHADHPTVQAFWRVAKSLPLEQKRRLLMFATGSDRVPIEGLSQLRMTLVSTGGSDERLMQAHTCFNTIIMPVYPSEEVVRARLMMALENCEGFGML